MPYSYCIASNFLQIVASIQTNEQKQEANKVADQ